MNNILAEITEHKRGEVADRKELHPVKLLEKSIYFNSTPVSLRKYLQRPDMIGVIAEIKRRSPSKGDLNKYISVEQLSLGYMQAGASALSILTDTKFFGGKNDDLSIGRKFNFCPILRKDFMIDPYQVLEAKSIGADVILLIAAAISPALTRELAALAKSLGMEVILEVHNAREIDTHLCEGIDLLGVNNRDLTTFTVSTEVSEALVDTIPSHLIKITESGISDAETIVRLKKLGYQGFLIGETFMKTPKPEAACRKLIEQVRSLEG
ncbi:MAG: indole-3-glycerol phosphate synthase TrpC [Pseudomonadota bacterium]|jgi:indole-3-glycerol phosphate synthase